MDIDKYLGKILNSEYLDNDEKEKQFRELLSKHPEYEYKISAFLANILFDNGKLDECILIIEKLLSLDDVFEDKNRLYYVIADCYAEKKDYIKAIEALNKLIDFFPNEEEAYHYVCLLYNKMSEFDKAFATLDRLSALEKLEIEDEMYYSKGLVYFTQKDYDNALVYFNKALLINSEHEVYNYFIASVYFEKEEWEHAIEWYKKEIVVNPESAMSYIYMSICYKNIGNQKLSDYFFEEGMNIDPDVMENIY